MSAEVIDFSVAFEALTDHRPLRWQQRLFDRMRSAQVPRTCDLPTGLGKTSVIPIWLIALAQPHGATSVTLARRLVYVVNRRTVVDQATTLTERMRERLVHPHDSRWPRHHETLRNLGEALRQLCVFNDSPLAVSTLRGELADNEEWKGDPARPAVIIGTIDMIGSKLLFSGYGDGPYWRPQHAGLIGHDSLIVHDEAHLTPAFSTVLYHVAEVQSASPEPRPVRVLELSATSRAIGDDVLTLEPEDEKDEIVIERLDAKKLLHLHTGGESEFSKSLVGLAKIHDGERAKVLIYVRSPEDAQKVASELRKQLGTRGQARVAILTGTLRGYERDKLARRSSCFSSVTGP